MTRHSGNLLTAEEIWDILESTCGAYMMKEDFIFHASRALASGKMLEYRFQGDLGYGGKVYINYDEKPRVSCYPEDETPKRCAMVKAANALLSKDR